MQPAKVLDSVMKPSVETEAVLTLCLDSHLKVAKKATGAGQSNRHRAKLAEKTMPTADRESALLLGNAVK